MENRNANFLQDLKEWNIELTDKQKEQFEKYYELLAEWNTFMNLTAITDYEEVMKKHFLDSLSFIKVKECVKKEMFSNFSVIDVGTGAGFPGIPIKIFYPECRVVLMDSLNKRIKFLDKVIEELGLENIETVHARAEDLAKNVKYREQFDFAVSRAVANIATLSEYCLPFVKKDGYFISYKSEKLSEELALSGNAIPILGGEIKETLTFQLPNSDYGRTLLIIEKIKNTPKKYPRKAGLPSGEPLK